MVRYEASLIFFTLLVLLDEYDFVGNYHDAMAAAVAWVLREAGAGHMVRMTLALFLLGMPVPRLGWRNMVAGDVRHPRRWRFNGDCATSWTALHLFRDCCLIHARRCRQEDWSMKKSMMLSILVAYWSSGVRNPPREDLRWWYCFMGRVFPGLKLFDGMTDITPEERMADINDVGGGGSLESNVSASSLGDVIKD